MNFLLILGLILCIGACAWLAWQVLQLKETLQESEKSNHLMQQDLHGLVLCMRGVSERFEKQQKQLRSVTIRQNDSSAKSTNDSHYEQAVMLMDKGATVEELIHTCGISEGEAELMNRISEIEFDTQNDQTALR